MASSSRLQRIGTIYSRVTGLLRSGALKPEDKPLWYDVYEAFPPKYEPLFGRKVPDVPVRNIFYAEDVIRAKFYKAFSSPGVFSMNEHKSKSLCQRFVDKYHEIEKSASSPMSENEIFEATVVAMEQDGITLRKSSAADAGSKMGTAETKESMSAMFQNAVQQQSPDKQA